MFVSDCRYQTIPNMSLQILEDGFETSKASAGSFLAEAKFVFSHKLRKNLTNCALD